MGWTFSKAFLSVRPRNLSSKPVAQTPMPMATQAASASQADSASRLMALMSREEALRGRPSQTDRVRHQLCQLKLLEVQAHLFESQADRAGLAEQARDKFVAHQSKVALLTTDWHNAGRTLPDFWEDDDDDEDPEQDIGVKEWLQRKRGGPERAAFDPPTPPEATAP